MDTAEIVLAGLVVVFGSGGVWAFLKVRSETAGSWVEVAEGLRTEIGNADDELRMQRRLRHELEDEVRVLEHRIDRLELWIIDNTDCDPSDINGPEDPVGVPV